MSVPVQTKYRDVLETLRAKVPGLQAAVVAGPDGVVDHVLADSRINLDAVAGEYAMLLRIAARTSEDTGGGALVEHVVVSEKSIAIARPVSEEHFLILLSSKQDQIGRARYELKKAAAEIKRRVRV